MSWNWTQTKRLLKGFKIHYRTSAILNFWQSYGNLKIASLYGEYMEPGCIGKSNTNNLPAPTELTENPYGKKKTVFKDATQKSAFVVHCRLQFCSVLRRAIFEKYPHLREKGGVLTKIWHSWNRLSRTVHTWVQRRFDSALVQCPKWINPFLIFFF
jgi:hypothetical protein